MSSKPIMVQPSIVLSSNNSPTASDSNIGKSPPYWPQANGEAERFMCTLEKAIRTAYIENKNRTQALYEFLPQYRASPHSTTNISPAEALNNRKLKIPLPNVVDFPQQRTHDSLRQKDLQKKEKMKEYADQRQHLKDND